MIYYREFFNKKLNKECYNEIYQQCYSKFKNIIYFTYYIIVIESLYNKDINLIYINSLSTNDIYYNIIKDKYKNILCIKNYNELDELYFENKIINTLRLLSIDMISNANSGHPGTPLGCAPTIYVLWCKIMRFNPKNPLLYDRDRFILSNGHACAILYSILYLLGYNYNIDDLKNFRKIHSITSGHPEFNQKLGIEIMIQILKERKIVNNSELEKLHQELISKLESYKELTQEQADEIVKILNSMPNKNNPYSLLKK